MSKKAIRREKLDHELSKIYGIPVYDLPFSLKCILLSTYQASLVEGLPEEYRDLLVSINLWSQDSAERVNKIMHKMKELSESNEEMLAYIQELEAEYKQAQSAS